MLDVVPIARLEGFRALKFSKFDYFRALKCIGQIGDFKAPNIYFYFFEFPSTTPINVINQFLAAMSSSRSDNVTEYVRLFVVKKFDTF